MVMGFKTHPFGKFGVIELPALSSAALQIIEQRLSQDYGLTPQHFSEAAGRNLAWLAANLLGDDLQDRPIVVLAGPGRKGAGGLAAAQKLIKHGAWVQVVLAASPEAFTAIAGHELAKLQTIGAPLAWAEEGWELPPADLLIDALTNEADSDDFTDKVRDLIYLANSSVAPIISLGAPSGLYLKSGALGEPQLYATATLMSGFPLASLLSEPGRSVCGDLYLADIGAPASLYAELGLTNPLPFARNQVILLHVEDGKAFGVLHGNS